VWAALCSALVLRMFEVTAPQPPIVYSLLAILLGIVLADFTSGFFHWFFDTFFDETTPLIGWYLIAPFREHHRDPLAVTRHSFLELTGNSFLACVLPLALVWWFADSPQSHWGVLQYTWWVSMAIALTITNQLHCWAHQPSPPRFARWLQRCRIAISASQHARHHAPPHRSAYCITNGWMNRLADKLRVFARLEKLFVAIGVPRTTARG
jgi:ubiquitin-conjugating enzyme E2 variant